MNLNIGFHSAIHALLESLLKIVEIIMSAEEVASAVM